MVEESLKIFSKDKASKVFAFNSFTTKIEVIKTLSKVRTECDKLADSNIFASNLTKTVKIDEFEQLQSQSIANMKVFLKENWINNVKNLIRSGFKDVGKGWYNMQESNMEVYNISKLKKLMNTIKFIMQDSIRFLVLNSINEFVKTISSIAFQKVVIGGTNNVKIYDSLSPFEISSKRPLFLVDLVFKHGKLNYNIDLQQFEVTLVSIFDKSFSTSENLPQLEPLVLEQIFWAAKPTLQGVHCKEIAARKARSKLIQSIRHGVSLLDEYILQYEKYRKLLNLDITQFAIEYEASEKTLEQMEQDIQHFQREWEILDKDVPSHISLGLFWVSCENIRVSLRKDLSKVILDLLSKNAAKMVSDITASFVHLQTRLKEKPTKIEELMELREFMLTIPENTKIQQHKISEMQKSYEVLDKHRFECSNEDFRSKWAALGWPGKIDEIMTATETLLASEEQNFSKSLQVDQEVFKDRVSALQSSVQEFSKHHDLTRINEIISEVNKISEELKEAQAMNILINNREKLFGLEPTKYEEISQLPREFESYKNLWLTANDWLKSKEQWINGSFIELNSEEVEKNHMNGTRNIFKSIKIFKNSPGCLEVANQIKDEMEEFKPYIPLIQALRNPGMRDRHWDNLSTELQLKVKPDENLTLTELLKMNLLDRIETITKVCDVAGKEYSIENALEKMDAEWKSIQLDIVPYKDTGTSILRLAEEVTRMLDDHIVMTQSMGFSPYKTPFAERIIIWENKLKTVQEVVEAWMACQRSWLYLEPIFSSDDIVTQLPQESKRFTTMDRTWRRILNQAKTKSGVIDFCSDMKLLDSFRECNKLLELVAKGLSAYLESKRITFPRFFFLSDDELLQILSQTKDPTAVQPHLRKCFENVTSIKFGDDNIITAMSSGEGEVVQMAVPFYPKGPVEEWLLKVEQSMRHSVREVVRAAILDYPEKDRNKWVLSWPGQAILSGSQTYWTQEVTEALKEGPHKLKELYTKLLEQLNGLVNLVRGELPFLNRLVLGDLIVIDVHNRDVVKRLVESNISSPNNFDWLSQLRYYWEEDDLRIKIVNADFK
jgi:dynein heavy chain